MQYSNCVQKIVNNTSSQYNSITTQYTLVSCAINDQPEMTNSEVDHGFCAKCVEFYDFCQIFGFGQMWF